MILGTNSPECSGLHSHTLLTVHTKWPAGISSGLIQAGIFRFRVPSADINPVVRVDSSGSTELITNYLATDPSWQLGTGKSIAWPKCIKQVQGTDGILAYLTGQKNAIG